MAAYLCIQHVNVWRGRRDWLKKKGKKKKVKALLHLTNSLSWYVKVVNCYPQRKWLILHCLPFQIPFVIKIIISVSIFSALHMFPKIIFL